MLSFLFPTLISPAYLDYSTDKFVLIKTFTKIEASGQSANLTVIYGYWKLYMYLLYLLSPEMVLKFLAPRPSQQHGTPYYVYTERKKEM